MEFSDLETNEVSDDATSDIEDTSKFEGVCGLLKDSDWNAILVDKPDILCINKSRTDVNNAK